MLGMFGPSFSPDRDIPDLSEKVFLVTGGNNGLGKETVLQLAKHNPRNIFLAARNQRRGEDAIADIKKQVPNANITFLSLDLTSLKSIYDAAEKVKSSTERLDVLINNAGVMALPAGLTKDGYEVQLGTNHIGHFLLTKQLMPLLEKTASLPGSDVRVVGLTSGGHQYAPKGGILFDGSIETDMASYNTFIRYGQSKLANILHIRELAKRHPSVKCMAAHPGPVGTSLSHTFCKDHPWIATFGRPLERMWVNSVEVGALTQLWAATSPDARSGKYYVPTAKENPGSAQSQDAEMARKLWEWTEAQLAKHGY